MTIIEDTPTRFSFRADSRNLSYVILIFFVILLLLVAGVAFFFAKIVTLLCVMFVAILIYALISGEMLGNFSIDRESRIVTIEYRGLRKTRTEKISFDEIEKVCVQIKNHNYTYNSDNQYLKIILYLHGDKKISIFPNYLFPVKKNKDLGDKIAQMIGVPFDFDPGWVGGIKLE